ncbi:kelch-like protein diablo [Scaptodrosophila lebanonensis]|uniref:Kelch-like protein diablo n=1 Tax=Drosophila lebanonensis TaxID=7225 RepID=A0A6J2TBU9_DROLE|nr:kelch-like protein diablo [Scaptodrosophila lebanonensis]
MASISTSMKHIEQLLYNLNEQRKEEKYTDVTLICNGIKFPAHKSVLASISPYFQAMFSGNFIEVNHDVDLGNDNNLEAWKLMLDFIYTGQLHLSEENVTTFLELASYLQLQGAQDLCVNYISDIMNEDNCLAFMQLAQAHNNQQLLSAAKAYMTIHWKQFLNTSSFLDISVEEILSILSTDSLRVHSNDDTLLGLERWAVHRLPERAAELPQILNELEPRSLSKSVVAGMNVEVLKANPTTTKWQHDLLDLPDPNRKWSIFALECLHPKGHIFFQRYNCYGNVAKATALPPHDDLDYGSRLALHGSNIFAQGSHKTAYYSLHDNVWRSIPGSPLHQRKNPSVIVLDGGLYTLGGHLNHNRKVTNKVERLDLATGVSHSIAAMHSERAFAGCATANGCIYMISGERAMQTVSGVECYDPRVGSWFKHLGPTLGYCSCGVVRSSIYVMALNAQCIVKWEPRTSNWQSIILSPEATVSQICVMNEKLYGTSSDKIVVIEVDGDFTLKFIRIEPINEFHEFYASTAGNVAV